MKHLIHRTVFLLGFGIAIFECHLAMAQVPAPSQIAPQPVSGSPFIVRSLWFEGLMTVVMIGAALFVICRSSNRS